MRSTTKLIGLTAGLMLAASAFAQAPAGAPAGATGLCNDGTYWTGATKSGACRGHKGVKDWYAAATASAAKSAAATPAPAAAPAPTPAPAAKAAAAPAAPAAATAPAAPASAKPAPAMKNMPTTAAPGGGPGLVWINTGGSKVYHCSGDKWYGKTKKGEYVTEADAKAKGYKPDHGKGCS